MNREYKNSINLQFLLLPILLYFFNIRKIIFPTNFQQDDVRELFISNYQSFTCILDQGDNHPLWTYTIWFLSKISFFEISHIISSLNILLFLGSLFYFYKFISEIYNYKLALLFSLFYVSAPVTLTYSISLKQYMLELFYSSYCLYVSTNLNKKIKSIQFYLVSFIFVIGSLVNIASFCLIVVFYFSTTSSSIAYLKKLIVIFIPIVFYFERVINKVTQVEFTDYWSNFFISFESFDAFYSKIVFIFNMIFKSYFGFIYFDQMVLILMSFFIFSIFSKNRLISFSNLYFLAFLCANILQIYPLGAGRTDLVLFPFVLSIFSHTTFIILKRLNSQTFSILIACLLLYFSINVDAYYKQEQVTTALEEIRKIHNKDSTLLISYEQYPSFEYYGQKVFGSEIEDIDGCLVSKPKLKNYEIVYRSEYNKTLFENQLSNAIRYKRVIVFGIEIDSRGVFRDSEEFLFNKEFLLKDSKHFPNGVYLNTYERK